MANNADAVQTAASGYTILSETLVYKILGYLPYLA